jgi:hypothetical protein
MQIFPLKNHCTYIYNYIQFLINFLIFEFFNKKFHLPALIVLGIQ